PARRSPAAIGSTDVAQATQRIVATTEPVHELEKALLLVRTERLGQSRAELLRAHRALIPAQLFWLLHDASPFPPSRRASASRARMSSRSLARAPTRLHAIRSSSEGTATRAPPIGMTVRRPHSTSCSIASPSTVCSVAAQITSTC